ncbi:PDGLE domain-containing protein [Candidatus Margulisiibacteriota bacterium]
MVNTCVVRQSAEDKAAWYITSANPDGLEKVAETLSFIEKGVEGSSIMTDYTVPFIAHEGLSTSLAGILGILITFGLFWGTAVAFKRRKAG